MRTEAATLNSAAATAAACSGPVRHCRGGRRYAGPGSGPPIPRTKRRCRTLPDCRTPPAPTLPECQRLFPLRVDRPLRFSTSAAIGTRGQAEEVFGAVIVGSRSIPFGFRMPRRLIGRYCRIATQSRRPQLRGPLWVGGPAASTHSDQLYRRLYPSGFRWRTTSKRRLPSRSTYR